MSGMSGMSGISHVYANFGKHTIHFNGGLELHAMVLIDACVSIKIPFLFTVDHTK